MSASMLSPRDARVLALGSVVVLLLLAGGRGVPAMLSRAAEHRRNAAETAGRAAQAEWSVRNAERTRKALGQVRVQLAAYDSALVDGTTPSGASAELAALVSDAASGAEARIGSIQLAADTLAGRAALARVTARVSVSGDLMAIALMLQLLEEGPQLLAVRELSLVPSQAGAVHAPSETLQAELLVEGLFRRRLGGVR